MGGGGGQGARVGGGGSREPEWGQGAQGPDMRVARGVGGPYLVSHLPYLVSHLPYLVSHLPIWYPISLIWYPIPLFGIPYLLSSIPSLYLLSHPMNEPPKWNSLLLDILGFVKETYNQVKIIQRLNVFCSA